jgi:hypothetical protein
MIKILSCAGVVGLLVASSSAFAGGRGFGGAPTMGASSISPGREFVTHGVQANGPTAGLPGASGYAPGQLYRAGAPTTATGPGASVYAPGFLK